MSVTFHGLPAAPGVGIGTIYIYAPRPVLARSPGPGPTADTPASRQFPDSEAEWRRFLRAREYAARDLEQLRRLTTPFFDDIFAAHREILYDKTLADAVRTAIDAGESAVAATREATRELVEQFESLIDDYFASRSADVRDVGERLLTHLEGKSPARQLADLPQQTILVAEDLTPSDTVYLNADRIQGIALASSAPTAHTAILARSLGLPLVCGLGEPILDLDVGQMAIVDGIKGELVAEPSPELVRRYEKMRQRLDAFRQAAQAQAGRPAITADGRTIPVLANVNSAEEIAQVVESGADGIGLLRTEYLFQYRAVPPTVQEEFQAYRHIAQEIAGQPITVRLLDIGGDKPVPYLPQPAEANPFLGLRGVRLLLQQPELLRNQFEALVQLVEELPEGQTVRVLIPMVSRVMEVHRVLAIFNQIPSARHYRERSRLQVGLMIEVPSAALLAAHLAPLVDFFSIGTNDLAQYALAADRVSGAVAPIATSLDPSVLRLMEITCQAAAAAQIPVGVCGEIASQPEVVPLLLGLGVTELSVIPPALPLVKQAVRRCQLTQCRQLARQALDCATPEEVEALLARVPIE